MFIILFFFYCSWISPTLVAVAHGRVRRCAWRSRRKGVDWRKLHLLARLPRRPARERRQDRWQGGLLLLRRMVAVGHRRLGRRERVGRRAIATLTVLGRHGRGSAMVLLTTAVVRAWSVVHLVLVQERRREPMTTSVHRRMT